MTKWIFLIICITAALFFWMHSFQQEENSLHPGMTEQIEQACCEHDHSPRRHADHEHDHPLEFVTVSYDQLAAAAPNMIQAESTTGWRGRFIDLEGLPVSGLNIEVTAPLTNNGQFYSSAWKAFGTTSNRGEFQITVDTSSIGEDLPAQVTISSGAWGGENRCEILYFSERVEMHQDQIINLGTLRLGEGPVFDGYVYDQGKSPITGALVQFTFTTGALDGFELRTNELGYYRAYGVKCFGDTEPETHEIKLGGLEKIFPEKKITVEPSTQYAPVSGGRFDFTVKVGELDKPIRIAQLIYQGAPVTSVTGVLLNSDGKVLEAGSQEFSLNYESPLYVPCSLLSSNVEGTQLEIYEKTGDRFARIPLQVEEKNGNAFLGASADPEWQTGAELNGTVLKGDQVLTLATVRLTNDARPLPFPRPYREARTNSVGSFTLRAVPDGTYRMLVSTGTTFVGEKQVTVKDGHANLGLLKF